VEKNNNTTEITMGQGEFGIVVLAATASPLTKNRDMLQKWNMRLRAVVPDAPIILAVPATLVSDALQGVAADVGWQYFSGPTSQCERLWAAAVEYRLAAVLRVTPENLMVPVAFLERVIATYQRNPAQAVTTEGYPRGMAATIFPLALLEQLHTAAEVAHPVKALHEEPWNSHSIILRASRSYDNRNFFDWQGEGHVVSYGPAERAPALDLRPGASGTEDWQDGSEPPAVSVQLRQAIIAKAENAERSDPPHRTAPAGKPRIVMLNHTAIAGGAEHSLIETATGLQARGWDVQVVFLKAGIMAEVCAKRGIVTTIIENVDQSQQQLRCAALLDEKPGAIVYANSAYALSAFLSLARERQLPVIAHIREFLDAEVIDKYNLGACSRVLTNSAATADRLRDFLPTNKLHVVHNGLDPARVRALSAQDEPLDRCGHEIVLGVCGRLIPYKGYHTAIQALRLVRDEKIDAGLVIIGSQFGSRPGGEEYENYLGELSRKLQLGPHIIRYPYHENPFGLLAGIDMLLVPTEGEPFGRVILEALALGKPVIATGDGGPSEILDRQFIVPSASAACLAQAISNYLRGPRLVPPYPEQFTYRAYLDRLEAALQGVWE